MHFLLDQNVARAVLDVIQQAGHTGEFSRSLIPADADDPVVATAAEDLGAILVSHDNDFNTIAPRVVEGHKRRFSRLSRIALQCPYPLAAARMAEMLPIIELLVSQAESKPDKRVIIFVKQHTMRTA